MLGSTAFTVAYTDTEKFSDGHPLYGLAVDPAQKRVYAIVQSLVAEEENEPIPVVGEIVAWNTEPNAEGKLEGAAGLPQDTITNSASLVAGASSLQPARPKSSRICTCLTASPSIPSRVTS